MTDFYVGHAGRHVAVSDKLFSDQQPPVEHLCSSLIICGCDDILYNIVTIMDFFAA